MAFRSEYVACATCCPSVVVIWAGVHDVRMCARMHA